MEIHVTEQALVFLWTVLSGMVSGLVYELFRIYRRFSDSSDKAVMLCDMLFWIISAAITFGVIFSVNSGQLRWYIFAGFVSGAAIYFFLLAKIASKVIVFIIRVIARVYIFINRIIKILLKPFVKIKRSIGKRAGFFKKLLMAYKAKASGKLRLLKKIRKNS